jgi:hypothetical protein
VFMGHADLGAGYFVGAFVTERRSFDCPFFCSWFYCARFVLNARRHHADDLNLARGVNGGKDIGLEVVEKRRLSYAILVRLNLYLRASGTVSEQWLATTKSPTMQSARRTMASFAQRQHIRFISEARHMEVWQMERARKPTSF